MRLTFKVIGVLGFIIICIMAFIIPNNPYEIIPSISSVGFDKTLWFAIIVGGGFLYLMTLLSLYERIENEKNKKRN